MSIGIKWERLKDAVLTKRPGAVTVHFTYEGKRYKMLLDEETLEALSTTPMVNAKQLQLKEGDE